MKQMNVFWGSQSSVLSPWSWMKPVQSSLLHLRVAWQWGARAINPDGPSRVFRHSQFTLIVTNKRTAISLTIRKFSRGNVNRQTGKCILKIQTILSGGYLRERQMQVQYLIKTKQNRSNQTVKKNLINEDITIKKLIFPQWWNYLNYILQNSFPPCRLGKICLPF